MTLGADFTTDLHVVTDSGTSVIHDVDGDYSMSGPLGELRPAGPQLRERPHVRNVVTGADKVYAKHVDLLVQTVFCLMEISTSRPTMAAFSA